MKTIIKEIKGIPAACKANEFTMTQTIVLSIAIALFTIAVLLTFGDPKVLKQ